MGKDMPHGKWWHSPRASKELNLSDEEKSKLDKQFVESRRKMIDLKGSVEREQFELENLLESESLDKAAVMEQFKRLEKARTDLAAERFNFVMYVRETLGFERFQRIKMFHGKLRREKRHRAMEHPGRDKMMMP
jgi:Spy/CpxP family protein refolding chaperone